MKLYNICRDVAMKHLSKPGTIVECMVGTKNFDKGAFYRVDASAPIGAKGLPWLRFYNGGKTFGKSPLDFRIK